LGLSAAVVAAALGIYSVIDDGRVAGPDRSATGLGRERDALEVRLPEVPAPAASERGGGELVVSGRFGPLFAPAGVSVGPDLHGGLQAIRGGLGDGGGARDRPDRPGDRGDGDDPGGGPLPDAPSESGGVVEPVDLAPARDVRPAPNAGARPGGSAPSAARPAKPEHQDAGGNGSGHRDRPAHVKPVKRAKPHPVAGSDRPPKPEPQPDAKPDKPKPVKPKSDKAPPAPKPQPDPTPHPPVAPAPAAPEDCGPAGNGAGNAYGRCDDDGKPR
jgi:hypothetical protein